MELIEGRATIGDVDAFLDRLAGIGETHGSVVQAFDARRLAGRRHLEAAVERASRAVERDDAIADDPAVELLCYAAARRQIGRALTIGVDRGDGPVVVVVDGGDEGAAAAAIADELETDAVLGETRDEAWIREWFEIADAELAATDADLEALVVERVALLAVEK